MPIYEYYCDKCDEKFETLVFGKEQPDCPKCGKSDVKRVMSACGFVTKGSGGETVSTPAGASSCGTCSSSSCSSCGV